MCIYVLKQLLHDKITGSFGDQQLQGLKLTRPQHHIKNYLCLITVKINVIWWGFEDFKTLKINRGSRRESNLNP